MKKIFLSMATAALLFCSCGDVYRTYETYEIVKPGTDMFVDYIEAKGADWQVSGVAGQQGCYVYQEYRFDEITEEVLNKGAVLVYLVDAEGRDNILPFVHNFEVGRDIILENIRYEVERGILTIVVTWDDFKIYNIDENLEFKVCILTPGKKS